ncbi:MAG: methyltransferase domain-containing protein [Isosphaeraceae bacterium]
MNNSTVRRRCLRTLAGLPLLGLAGCSVERKDDPPALIKRSGEVMRGRPETPYVPTEPEVVDAMLEMAQIRPGDRLYDLGSGDGRIVIRAAEKYGIPADGFEIERLPLKFARENLAKTNLAHLVTFHEQDLFTVDLTPANVVTLFLLPRINERLKPQLRKLRPGSRIVGHTFDIAGTVPERVEVVRTASGEERKVFLWIMPWKEVESAPSDAAPRATP